MKKNLVSIIVPVYNVEQYLEKCVQSILLQTYDDFEILLVDDGSTDLSAKMCDEMSKTDERIKVFHKLNGGLSDARNYGIAHSLGEYVTFVDSDDVVANDYLEHLMYLLKKYNTDIAIAQLKVVTNNRLSSCNEFVDAKINKIEALNKLLCENEFGTSVCAKIFRKKLFDEIDFPKGKLYEDNGTTYKLIEQCDYVCYSTKKIYFYYKRKTSITNSLFNMKKLDLIELVDKMAVDLKKYPELADAIHRKQIEARFSILRQVVLCQIFDEKVYNECFNYLINNKDYIFKNPLASKRQKIAYFLMRCGKSIFKLSWKIYSFVKY